VAAQFGRDLAGANVESHYRCCSLPQKAFSEAPDAGAHIQRAPSADIDRESIEGRFELVTSATNERRRAVYFDAYRFVDMGCCLES
jgi:hypothetical protein